MKSSQNSPSGASQLVRSAEKNVEAGKYPLAMEQLLLAQRQDPNNHYIKAIIERVRLLDEAARNRAANGIQAGGDSVPESDRYLSVTVGKQFEEGIKGSDEGVPSTPEELTKRVRELTDTAEILLHRGLRESAFDALMKAYLLDPLSPAVLSCEKKVLPAWEYLRKERSAAQRSDRAHTGVPPIQSSSDRSERLQTGKLSRGIFRDRFFGTRKAGEAPGPADGQSSSGSKKPKSSRKRRR